MKADIIQNQATGDTSIDAERRRRFETRGKKSGKVSSEVGTRKKRNARQGGRRQLSG